jgi:hypothetical protein
MNAEGEPKGSSFCFGSGGCAFQHAMPNSPSRDDSEKVEKIQQNRLTMHSDKEAADILESSRDSHERWG